MATEQNPTKLGKTVKELDLTNVPVFPKTRFSMCTADVDRILDQHKPISVVLFGIEVRRRPLARACCRPSKELPADRAPCTAHRAVRLRQAHVCVLQTALELRSRGVAVHVVADGTSSRSNADRLIAFDRMRQSGVFVSTSESILFQLLVDSEHSAFRSVSALVKPPLPENGLLRVRTEPDTDAKL